MRLLHFNCGTNVFLSDYVLCNVFLTFLIILSVVLYLSHFFLFIFTIKTDPPEISVENNVVYSGEGQEAVLVCIVHGESQPEVSFFYCLT